MSTIPSLRLPRRFSQWWTHQRLPFDLTPGAPRFDTVESRLPDFVRHCSIGLRYYHLLRDIDWSSFPEPQSQTETHFCATIPKASFVAACLIKLDQQMTYMSHLRQYLGDHPSLIWLLGFPLMPSSNKPWGFDADASLPTARHFTRLLRKLPNSMCQFLLDESVRLLRVELGEVAPDFGQAISLDTKHILAWVKENNPKAYVSDRFDNTKQPTGDPDCKLGCKKRHNQQGDVEKTPTTNPLPARNIDIGEFYWGYASGVVATKVPGHGEFVLAEFTQPFDRADVSYFFPLMEATEQRLGTRPHFGAFDAAFDAYYVYEYFHHPNTAWQQAFAAVPYSKRNGRHKTFNPDGDPYCEADQVMQLAYTFTCRSTLYEHQRDHYICPFKKEGGPCPIDHKRWKKGGCTMRLPSSVGSRLRHQIDRESALYHKIYNQRTATERINAQATELGIERPRLRNQMAITNQNTLIYVLINLRGLRRIRQQLACPNASGVA